MSKRKVYSTFFHHNSFLMCVKHGQVVWKIKAKRNFQQPYHHLYVKAFLPSENFKETTCFMGLYFSSLYFQKSYDNKNENVEIWIRLWIHGWKAEKFILRNVSSDSFLDLHVAHPFLSTSAGYSVRYVPYHFGSFLIFCIWLVISEILIFCHLIRLIHQIHLFVISIFEVYINFSRKRSLLIFLPRTTCRGYFCYCYRSCFCSFWPKIILKEERPKILQMEQKMFLIKNLSKWNKKLSKVSKNALERFKTNMMIPKTIVLQ